MVREAEGVVPAVSFGGVVYRRGQQCVEVVLCGRRAERLWSLPKGTPEIGESMEHTATREVQEETGLAVSIVSDLGDIRYQFSENGTRYDKRVSYYLMSPVGGSLDLHDGEFDDARWFCTEEALRLMTYPNERDVLRRAMQVIDKEQGA
jgi:8-oxo-dGTP pyrophosphatase MutT (NUDIX family)